ncbi:hypothetical protein [Vibrio genomosp. F6]|uniref:Uncharacterized protein n=1 Tax=Vibrio genomosp. F6 str. FF-238 TaxID=1191298 RepID=A0A1E5CWZ3_9VIBR|nr:hypothetical protein [Vibrio genomosp. F6]OEE75040.1 hypothetical protein A130_17365 [Vibrio genomosp. F6 str. FF-238]
MTEKEELALDRKKYDERQRKETELKAVIDSEPAIFEWSRIDYYHQHGNVKLGCVWWFSVLFVILGLFLSNVYFEGENGIRSDDYFFVIFVSIMFSSLWTFWWFTVVIVKQNFTFRITQTGFSREHHEYLPLWLYSGVRKLAYVGMAICVLAFFLIGPAAFIGVGGCALMSFGLANTQRKVIPQATRWADVQLVSFSNVRQGLLFHCPDVHIFDVFMLCPEGEMDNMLKSVIELVGSEVPVTHRDVWT